MVQVKCPHCFHVIKGNRDAFYAVVQCPSCGKRFKIEKIPAGEDLAPTESVEPSRKSLRLAPMDKMILMGKIVATVLCLYFIALAIAFVVALATTGQIGKWDVLLCERTAGVMGEITAYLCVYGVCALIWRGRTISLGRHDSIDCWVHSVNGAGLVGVFLLAAAAAFGTIEEKAGGVAVLDKIKSALIAAPLAGLYATFVTLLLVYLWIMIWRFKKTPSGM